AGSRRVARAQRSGGVVPEGTPPPPSYKTTGLLNCACDFAERPDLRTLAGAIRPSPIRIARRDGAMDVQRLPAERADRVVAGRPVRADAEVAVRGAGRRRPRDLILVERARR